MRNSSQSSVESNGSRSGSADHLNRDLYNAAAGTIWLQSGDARTLVVRNALSGGYGKSVFAYTPIPVDDVAATARLAFAGATLRASDNARVRIVSNLRFDALEVQTSAAAPALCAYRWGTGGCEKGLYDQWGAWVGEPGIWAEDFMPKESWDKIEGEAWQLGVWSKWRTYAPGRRLVLSVPMLVGPWDRSCPKSGPRAGEPVSLAKGAP